MGATLISFAVNVLVAVLLVAVIIYCRRLNANIRVLQNSRSEMAKLFADFDKSIDQAQKSVQELQESAKETQHILKDRLDKANLVADDLTFMIERGIKMADKLEGDMKGRKPGSAAASPPPSAKKPEPAARPQPKAEEKPVAPSARKSGGASGRTTASIESVLEQMANRNNPKSGSGGAAADKKTSTRIRSRAEQELFDSLKSGR